LHLLTPYRAAGMDTSGLMNGGATCCSKGNFSDSHEL
jgi:hypothetical protein